MSVIFVLNWKTKAVYNLIYWNRTEKRFSYHDESKLKLQFIPLLLFIPISIWILKYTQCKILFDFKTMESLRVLGWTVKSNGLDLGNSQENWFRQEVKKTTKSDTEDLNFRKMIKLYLNHQYLFKLLSYIHLFNFSWISIF